MIPILPKKNLYAISKVQLPLNSIRIFLALGKLSPTGQKELYDWQLFKSLVNFKKGSSIDGSILAGDSFQVGDEMERQGVTAGFKQITEIDNKPEFLLLSISRFSCI